MLSVHSYCFSVVLDGDLHWATGSRALLVKESLPQLLRSGNTGSQSNWCKDISNIKINKCNLTLKWAHLPLVVTFNEFDSLLLLWTNVRNKIWFQTVCKCIAWWLLFCLRYREPQSYSVHPWDWDPCRAIAIVKLMTFGDFWSSLSFGPVTDRKWCIRAHRPCTQILIPKPMKVTVYITLDKRVRHYVC